MGQHKLFHSMRDDVINIDGYCALCCKVGAKLEMWMVATMLANTKSPKCI